MQVLKYSFLFALMLILRVCGYSQRTDYNFQPNIPVTPPSPEASALGKFGDIPVSLSTGIPSISVPIYQIDISGFKLPISLDYHAGGVKVDEIASNVGLGWALNAGGAISCKVNGIADRFENGTWNRGLPADPINFSPNSYNGTLNNAFANDFTLATLATGTHPTVDMMPDEYFYNFAGRSGKFVLDENQVPCTIPFEPIKIQDTFSIRDENGVLFEFHDAEVTNSSVSCTPTQPRPVYSGHKSAYFLSKVTTPKGDNIVFTYTDISYAYDQSWSESSSIVVQQSGCGVNPLLSHCLNHVSLRGKRLSTITSSTGITVTFNYDPQERADLPGTNRLQSITITDPESNAITFTLTHSYFGGNRLKLDAVLEAGKSPYTFDYIQSGRLPSRLAYSQDHWGFYNGQPNTGLIPTQSFVINGNRMQFTGANREPDKNFTSYGTLDKITYPTGGSTQFEYENNNYLSSSPEVVIINQHVGVTAGVYIDHNDGPQNLTATINNTTYPYFTNGNCNDGHSPCPTLSWNLPDPAKCRYTVSVVDPDGTNICCFNQATGQTLLPSIKSGQWRFNLNIAACDIGSYGDITLRWSDRQMIKPYSNQTSGGLRIKTIRNFTDAATLATQKSFEYLQKDTPDKSSGKTNDISKYDYHYVIYHPTQSSTGSNPWLDSSYGPITTFCEYIGLTSFSTEPLGTNKGNSVGYTDVTVYENGSVPNGKTYNKFKFVDDLGPDAGRVDLPDFLPRKVNTSYDFLCGLMEETTEFKSLPDLSYVPVRQTKYEYNVRHNPDAFWGYRTAGQAANEKNILGVNISKVFEYTDYSTPAFGFSYVKFPSVWISLSKKTESVFQDNSTIPQMTETNFYYDNAVHAQVSRETGQGSTGQVTTKCTLYPGDYASTTGFLYDMKLANIIKPIESITYKTDFDGGNPVILSGILNTYKSGVLAGLPESVRYLKNSTPISKAGFKFSNQTSMNSFPYEGPSSTLTMDSHYPASPDCTSDYDANNNVALVQKINDTPSSLIWGYDNSLVIAKIMNADKTQVAFTSFENSTSTGGWTFTYDPAAISTGVYRTGNKSYAGNQSMVKTGLPPGTYLISFWAKANNGTNSGNVSVNGVNIPITNALWEYKEKEVVIDAVTTGVTVGFSWLNGPNGINIDELRLSPKTAQMTTYTYGRLKGLTSATDANNKTEYYDYDGVCRLKTVKDNDGNIVKSFGYHYYNGN